MIGLKRRHGIGHKKEKIITCIKNGVGIHAVFQLNDVLL
jgi:hypothetical protein